MDIDQIFSNIMKVLKSKEFLMRFISIIFLLLGISTTDIFRFILMLISGIMLGIYYGLYNDVIWRPKGSLGESFPYRAHQLWIHIICGLIGSISLYFLLGAINIYNPLKTLKNFGFTEFTLFGIALLGYVGLLPRILWYFSYAQQGIFKNK
ncbi:MAG: hypothetical protein US75_C0003G0026 [Candidatus Woesebacteria bacterium GW2011_GWC1_38_13]|uniref:Uncharacterized protein n=2 Tax=Candidatus Woeseibacteriota TaxID=1752722 RepID=A0A0G0KVN9_9BACT|nr:MAG: hypothetical protein US75_C0003G0026 [Candidatus Woesebacteria bacterium GW2011_GWC1_38_13]KKQ83758.1 MAG: hypothetical protein UT06_C0017G0034 [Candidatus Woesebacteria bacterium GW2011_GWA1_38_8]